MLSLGCFHWKCLQGLEKDQRFLSEEVNSLRSQLERTRDEKAEVEDQLSDTQVMLAQEQQDHKQLQQSRAREVEFWSEERETSLSLVKEMTREVRDTESGGFLVLNNLSRQRHHDPLTALIWLVSYNNKTNVEGWKLKKSKRGAQSTQLHPAELGDRGGVRGPAGPDSRDGVRDPGTEGAKQT